MKHPRLLVIGLCFAGLALIAPAQEQESSDQSSSEPSLTRPRLHEKGDFKRRPPGAPGEKPPMIHDRPPIPPEMIEKFDADKDGNLSPEEMKAAHDEIRNSHKEELLKKFDKNSDGKLSDAEMEKLQKAREEAMKDQLIKEYDANGNGRLDSVEKKKILEDAKLQPMKFEWLNRPGPNPLKELVK